MKEDRSFWNWMDYYLSGGWTFEEAIGQAADVAGISRDAAHVLLQMRKALHALRSL